MTARATTAAAENAIADETDARALCASLARTAALLADLIERETEVLAAGRAHEIEQFQGDKAELSGRYLADMTRLRASAETVRALVPDEVEALKPQLHELGAKLVRNQDALAAVLSLSERLIRTAALKAIAADSGPATYGSDAQIGPAKIGNPATAIDRRL